MKHFDWKFYRRKFELCQLKKILCCMKKTDVYLCFIHSDLKNGMPFITTRLSQKNFTAEKFMQFTRKKNRVQTFYLSKNFFSKKNCLRLLWMNYYSICAI